MLIEHKIIAVFALFTMQAEATLPRDPSINDYNGLLKRSPFMIKKSAAPVINAPKIDNPFTLRGVSMFDDGWFVTLVDRKAPNERIFLRQGKPANSQGISLLKVNKNTSDYLKTTVTINSRGQKFTVGYNPTEIKNGLAKATGQPKSAKRPTTMKKPPTPSTNSSTRRPRVRRTTAPTSKPSK